MPAVEIYTKSWCVYCRMARSLLESRELDYTEIDLTSAPERENEMIMRAQRSTVPQIFINKQSIGGFTDLNALLQSGELKVLLDRGKSEEGNVSR